MVMTSSRPYIVKALYQWIVDNQVTPCLLIDATEKGVLVPEKHVKDGRIVLNISPSTIIDLAISDKAVEFIGRFDGMLMDVCAPTASILGIYAEENGQGMVFDTEGSNTASPPEPPKVDKPPKARTSSKRNTKKLTRPNLKLIK